MFGGQIRCCRHVKHLSPALLDVTNSSNLKKLVAGVGHQISYSNKSGSCKDVQEGMRVEMWPKPEPQPPAWRAECPTDPQPTNYDPYRIKGPEIVVPPLEGAPAKPMIDCAKKGPCSPAPAPPPPPCPPPPPKPFPWAYVYLPAALLAVIGVFYRYWLYQDRIAKLGEGGPIWQPRRKLRRPFHAEDLPPCVQYLIVGTGAAGWAAYEAIMEHDKEAKVFFVTKEDILPYLRLPMSKQMWWNPAPPDLTTLPYLIDGKRYSLYLSSCPAFMDPIKFYRKKEGPAVSLASGWCVSRIDAEEHIAYIRTNCGERPMYYERCLLAVGSKPKNLSIFTTAPKAVRKRVTTFRTIRDLEIAYRKVQEADHVTVIGGGFLGCELAWHLGRMTQLVPREGERKPLEIVHMYKDPGLLGNILPEYLGEWAAEKIKCEGVKIMPRTTPHDAFLSKDGRLELTLNDGSSYVTDYVFVCVGNTPRMDMAEPSFLEQDDINGGFVVNTELEARKDLYVAGDAASFYSQWKDTRQRHEHYMNAVEQGRLAGANMTGGWEPCNVEPGAWLRLGAALEMQVVGEVGACMPVVALFKPCRAEDIKHTKAAANELPCYKDAEEYRERYKRGLLCYLRDETIVGFVFWNMPPIDDRKEVATEILRARPSYKDINLVADLLGFPDTHCVYTTPEEVFEPGPCIKNWKVW